MFSLGAHYYFWDFINNSTYVTTRTTIEIYFYYILNMCRSQFGSQVKFKVEFINIFKTSN